MKKSWAIFILGFLPVLLKAEATNLLTCVESNQESANPKYHLVKLKTGEASLKSNHEMPTRSPVELLAEDILSQHLSNPVECALFSNLPENAETGNPSTNSTFTEYSIPTGHPEIQLLLKSVDLKTVEKIWDGTPQQINSDSAVLSLANYTIPTSSQASQDASSAGSRSYLNKILLSLTAAGVVTHYLGAGELALLYSGILFLGTPAGYRLAYYAAIDVFAYNAFINQFATHHEDIEYNPDRYFGVSRSYYIPEALKTLKSSHFAGMPEANIWESHKDLIAKRYVNLAQEFEQRFKSDYSSYLHNGDSAAFYERVYEDYDALRMKQQAVAGDFNLSLVTNSLTATYIYRYILVNLLKAPATFSVAFSVLTQELFNMAMDTYYGCPWEEEVFNFWHYNPKKDLSSPTNTRYFVKRVATRNVFPTVLLTTIILKTCLGSKAKTL